MGLGIRHDATISLQRSVLITSIKKFILLIIISKGYLITSKKGQFCSPPSTWHMCSEYAHQKLIKGYLPHQRVGQFVQPAKSFCSQKFLDPWNMFACIIIVSLLTNHIKRIIKPHLMLGNFCLLPACVRACLPAF